MTEVQLERECAASLRVDVPTESQLHQWKELWTEVRQTVYDSCVVLESSRHRPHAGFI